MTIPKLTPDTDITADNLLDFIKDAPIPQKQKEKLTALYTELLATSKTEPVDEMKLGRIAMKITLLLAGKGRV